MLVVFVFLYVLSSQVKYETFDADSREACVSKGKARIAEVERLSGYEGGIYANCIQVKE